MDSSPLQCLEKKPLPCEESTLDIAIIGAGIAGSYSAYLLRNHAKKIGLYEISSRIGGRVHSATLPTVPDLPLELGAMRYVKGRHLRMQKIVKELGLTEVVYPEGFGRKGRTTYHLRGKTVPLEDVLFGDVPYELLSEEKDNQGRIIEYCCEKLTGRSAHEIARMSRQDFVELKAPDGSLLRNLSVIDAIKQVASSEALALVQDLNGMEHMFRDNTSPLDFIHYYSGEDSKGQEVMTVKEGMNAIPISLVNKFLEASRSHSLFLNMQLVSIDGRDSNGFYKLTFRETETFDGITEVANKAALKHVKARKVILAIPMCALQEVKWSPLRSPHVKTAMKAIHIVPASKVIFSFDKPWWLTEGKRPFYTNVSSLIIGRTTHIGQSEETGQYALIVSYTDAKSTHQQERLAKEGDPIPGSAPGAHQVSSALKDEMLNELAEVFDIAREAIPEPTGAVAQFWSSYPFGGGWHVEYPGCQINDVSTTLKRPDVTQDVFVVGSAAAWATRSHWCEGALETVEDMFKDHFML